MIKSDSKDIYIVHNSILNKCISFELWKMYSKKKS